MAGRRDLKQSQFVGNRYARIERGELADLIVLPHDPLREDPFTLVKIPIARTMLGGSWVSEA